MRMKTIKHPGCLIKAAMKAAGVRQNAFANNFRMAPTQVSEVLSGKRPMTASFCVALEDAGVGDAEVWAFLYARFEVGMARLQ